MRVCLIAYRYYEANSHMQQFARAFADRGDLVDVICVQRPGLPKVDVVDGVRVWRLTERPDVDNRVAYIARLLFFIVWAGMFVGWRHFRHRYDFVHVQTVPDILLFAAILPRLFGAALVLDIRDLTAELYASKFDIPEASWVFRFMMRTERWCAALADHVIVANPIWQERVINRSVAPNKCSMLWYGPDPTLFYPRPRVGREGACRIVYPGSLSSHQGVDILLKALPKIAKWAPGAELHLYTAEGPALEQLRELAARLGLADTVRFFKVLPVKDIAAVMADSDVAVVPKRASDRFGDEAASTKIPEFMAVGVPVVASRTAIETRFFDDTQVCYFHSEDEEDLVRAVVSVMRDPILRNKLVRKGIECVGHSAQQLRDDYLRLADRLVEAKRCGSKSLIDLVDYYYTVRPLVPRRLQIAVRRQRAKRMAPYHQAGWPVAPSAVGSPPGFRGWPNAKRFALVLTHDVEQESGLRRCETLASLEEERGFRSAFGFVPLRYDTPDVLWRGLVDRGFETMVHDLYHDGKLFRDRKTFDKRKALINDALRRFSTRGFASGAMHHNLPWISELDVAFDISTFDVDPFEPRACGMGRIFPYWVEPPDGKRPGFVEFPYTLPQDFTLFVLMRERSINLWRKKLDWVAANGGMALIKTHPDYMSFGPEDRRTDHYPAEFYIELLDYIWNRYRDEVWVATPSAMAEYWRGLRSPEATTSNAITAPPELCAACRDAHAAGWLKNYPS